MSLRLTSTAFGEGEPIPRQFTCDGADQSPPLQWEDAPAATASFAIVCDDPDAPGGTFAHWGLFDIPAEVGSLAEGHSSPDRPSPYREAVNDFGRPAWGGPCPPSGHGAHRYQFRIFALDTAQLDIPEGAPVAEVERAALQNALDEARLEGLYER